MTPKEKKGILIRLSDKAKETLEEERKRLGMSQSAYVENLINGEITGRLESKIEELRSEILSLKAELKK